MIATTDPLYRLVWLSRPLHQEVEKAVAAALPAGLTVRMRAVLEALHDLGPSTVPTIARHLEIQRQYVQLMVNEVAAARFAEARPNPASKRSPLFHLTEEGTALIEAVRTREQALLARIAETLPAEDIQTALRITEQVLAAFKEENTR